MFLRTLLTTLGSHLDAPDRNMTLRTRVARIIFLPQLLLSVRPSHFLPPPVLPVSPLSQSAPLLPLDPLPLLPAHSLTALSPSPAPPSVPPMRLRFPLVQLPHQVSVPSVLHQVTNIGVEVELTFLLGALDSLLQTVSVPTPFLLPPPPLPHPFVCPVVQNISVSQLVAPVIFLH